MAFLNIFSGPPLEKLEKKGDAFFESGLFGQAKLAYERALGKAEKERLRQPDAGARLLEKIENTKEALAAVHQKSAEDLMDGGYFDDARPLISLATEITSNEARIRELTALADKLTALQQVEAEKELVDPYYGLADEPDPEDLYQTTPDEQFEAICGPLPPEIREAYLSYGEDFRDGYLALNAGDFESAVAFLSRALTADSTPGSYISLELATAYLRLGRLSDARGLLVLFLEHHPEALPGYQLLCEICWEEKDFRQADTVLDSVPENFSDSLAVLLLRGETRCRAGDVEEAKTLYRSFLDRRGWREEVALALAGVQEVSGEEEKARLLYREMMGRCTGCGAKIDPEIKHKYAELSFAAGIQDTNVLELYLSLAREIPDRAPEYYGRVSRIYAAQGNETEAARFRVFAKRAVDLDIQNREQY